MVCKRVQWICKIYKILEAIKNKTVDKLNKNVGK